MNIKRNIRRLWRPGDAFLPASFLIAALLGRDAVSLFLFIAFYSVKLCALVSSNGLRNAFARQPSMRYVQGSATLALLLQLPGAAIAALIAHLTGQNEAIYALISCGLLLNIEHVFYEYLFSVGDGQSAILCRGITALLTLAGILLSSPRSPEPVLPAAIEVIWPLITSGLSAMVGLVISLTLGGRFKPKYNGEILRAAPLALLQTLLYPALAIAAMVLLKPGEPAALPLFAGLALYEPCRTPFRRTPTESGPLNRALLIASAAALLLIAVRQFALPDVLPEVVTTAGCAVLLAALCAFALFGNVNRKGE